MALQVASGVSVADVALKNRVAINSVYHACRESKVKPPDYPTRKVLPALRCALRAVRLLQQHRYTLRQIGKHLHVSHEWVREVKAMAVSEGFVQETADRRVARP